MLTRDSRTPTSSSPAKRANSRSLKNPVKKQWPKYTREGVASSFEPESGLASGSQTDSNSLGGHDSPKRLRFAEKVAELALDV